MVYAKKKRENNLLHNLNFDAVNLKFVSTTGLKMVVPSFMHCQFLDVESEICSLQSQSDSHYDAEVLYSKA